MLYGSAPVVTEVLVPAAWGTLKTADGLAKLCSVDTSNRYMIDAAGPVASPLVATRLARLVGRVWPPVGPITTGALTTTGVNSSNDEVAE